MAGYEFSREPCDVSHVLTKNRSIKTPIPAPGTKQILDQLDQFESRSMHGQLPIVWDGAKDFSVYDIAGNKWIDFTSTIFVANVGHSNLRVASAIGEMLKRPLLSTYAYANNVRAQYLESLVRFAGRPFEKGFLLSAGTEATEAALKLMRMYGQQAGKRKPGIICIEGNWHGRTMGAQMMSSNLVQRQWIGFQDENIHHIPFPYPWVVGESRPEQFLASGLNKLQQKGVDVTRDIAGFMLETFQGWGAVFYPIKYVRAIEDLCKKHNILLTFDEMQSGFARTGRAFGYEHYGVKPDLICCGKGMGGGMPLSGVLGRAALMDLPDVGNMSSTHSANPLVCAAGLAVLEEITSLNLIKEAERKGELLFSHLHSLQRKHADRIPYILGRGLVAAVLFRKPGLNEPDPSFASRVSERCMQKGLLVVHTGRESIKLGPPLTISDDALVEGVQVLAEAVGELASA